VGVQTAGIGWSAETTATQRLGLTHLHRAPAVRELRLLQPQADLGVVLAPRRQPLPMGVLHTQRHSTIRTKDALTEISLRFYSSSLRFGS
jgi:hypothetical protein